MKQSNWMISASRYVGLMAFIYALTLNANAWWWVLSFIGHISLVCILSVISHRYYSHSSFSVGPITSRIFAVLSTLIFQTGPVSWAITHIGHHAYSDTNKDTTIRGWKSLFVHRHRTVPFSMVRKVVRKLRKYPWCFMAQRNSLTIPILFTIVLCIIDPMLALFLYLIPLGTMSLAFAIHENIAHRNRKPRHLPFMEFILPTGGEWNHIYHHKVGYSAKFGMLDIGYWVIRLIAKPGSIRLQKQYEY